MIPLAGNRSHALWVAHCETNPWLHLVLQVALPSKEGWCRLLLASCSLGSCGLVSVVSSSGALSGSRGSSSATSSTLVACTYAEHFLKFSFVCMIIIIIILFGISLHGAVKDPCNVIHVTHVMPWTSRMKRTRSVVCVTVLRTSSGLDREITSLPEWVHGERE